jgi:RNA polymerase sigma-70 factor, ECF subfamily
MARKSPTASPPAADFDHLIERFYRPVSYFFSNRGFSHEESRDLAQETFLGVYKGLDRFRGDSSVETWLFKIAANIWRNAIRSRSAEKRDGLEISADDAPDEPDLFGGGRLDPLVEALSDERVRLLRAAIDELPPQMRRCLLLRIDHDMKYREIAAVLQISIQTVKSQLFQAKERLKERLVDHFPELDS